MVQRKARSRRGPLAVIDVGAHSARLEVAQRRADGRWQALEELSYPVPLGADVFRNGVISARNMRLLGNLLRDFRRVMEENGVRTYRAVATSAIREAGNQDILLYQLEQMSGLRLEILHGGDEIRLIYLAVMEALAARFGLRRRNAVILTVGTGASQITFLEGGQITSADTIRLGTLRLVEQLEGPVSAARLREVIDPFVAGVVNGIARLAPGRRPELFLAVGSSVRALVNLGRRGRVPAVTTVSRQRFERLFGQVAGVPVAELARTYGLADTDAQSLEPCCNMLAHFFQITDAERLIVPSLTTRDALLQDLARSQDGNRRDPFVPQILSVARRLGEKYNYDAAHAAAVTTHAGQLFDALAPLHGLHGHDRVLLAVASILHDVGLFVSSREHHKHSFYLVGNCEIPGISPAEQELLAVVVRYHRRATPRPQHPEYMALAPADRVRASKLAALLRVADALDRCHQGKVRRFTAAVEEERVVIAVRGVEDLTLEQWGMKRKADLFEEVFGLRAELVGQM